MILTARDENHTTSGILRYFSSQRQISISLNTNMHQIISTYLVDNYRPLKHVQRSHSPVLSAKKLIFVLPESRLENDRRGVIDVDIVPTMTMLDIPYHDHHRVRV